jgi:AraC-like DNA-binding protein
MMNVERHLVLQALTLSPSAEWIPHCNGWMMLRAAEGAGYWLQQGATHRQLGIGDGLIVIRNANGLIRASQLNSLKIQLFTIQPQYLNGLLTVAEWQRLEVTSDNPLPPVSIFAADEPVGQRFMRLADQTNNDRLPVRCALLLLWANAVAGLLHLPVSSPSGGNKLRDHFRELVGQMTEAELSERSLAELAGQLHCSERHFSRLFREEFGVPFRSRQNELRLQRARQLLADPHASVLNVAHESGYRYLAPFNAIFKKRFGLTPVEWHRRFLGKGFSLSQ